MQEVTASKFIATYMVANSHNQIVTATTELFLRASLADAARMIREHGFQEGEDYIESAAIISVKRKKE